MYGESFVFMHTGMERKSFEIGEHEFENVSIPPPRLQFPFIPVFVLRSTDDLEILCYLWCWCLCYVINF